MDRVTTVFLIGICVFCSLGLMQAQTRALSQNDLEFFTGVFLMLGSPESGSDVVAAKENQLIHNFALNEQEAVLLRSLGREFRSFVEQLRRAGLAIVNGNNELSPSDVVALDGIVQERDRKILELARRLMNSVRPETAIRLLGPGELAEKTAKKTGGK